MNLDNDTNDIDPHEHLIADYTRNQSVREPLRNRILRIGRGCLESNTCRVLNEWILCAAWFPYYWCCMDPV